MFLRHSLTSILVGRGAQSFWILLLECRMHWSWVIVIVWMLHGFQCLTGVCFGEWRMMESDTMKGGRQAAQVQGSKDTTPAGFPIQQNERKTFMFCVRACVFLDSAVRN